MFKTGDKKNIMKACMILHNIIIKDDLDDNEVPNFEYEQVDDSLCKLLCNHKMNLWSLFIKDFGVILSNQYYNIYCKKIKLLYKHCP